MGVATCRSNFRLCCQKRQQCRSNIRLCRKDEILRYSFGIVAVCGNKVEICFHNVERSFDNVACCFDIVAGVDGAQERIDIKCSNHVVNVVPKIPSTPATMSRQHCQMLQSWMSLRQSRTLLRRCCWCVPGLNRQGEGDEKACMLQRRELIRHSITVTSCLCELTRRFPFLAVRCCVTSDCTTRHTTWTSPENELVHTRARAFLVMFLIREIATT